MSKSVSVCIPSRGPSIGLWATIVSALEEWPQAEVIVCVNGRDEDEPLYLLKKHLRVTIIHSQEALHPATARDIAGSHATGDVLMFLDDHVIVPRSVSLPSEGIAHYAYHTYPGHPDTYYHFVPGDELPTKGDYAKQPEVYSLFYPCLSGSHAMFAVTRAAWGELGGYGGQWQGFGGEEAYLGLKARLHGIPVTMYPQCVFWHFSARSSQRGYLREIDEDNYRYGVELLRAEEARLRNIGQISDV